MKYWELSTMQSKKKKKRNDSDYFNNFLNVVVYQNADILLKCKYSCDIMNCFCHEK